jgi:hypothetical protein
MIQITYLIFKPLFHKETASKRKCKNILGKIIVMTFNFMLPLTALVLALLNMRFDRLYFLWTIISIGNTIVLNILVYSYPPIMVRIE